MLPKCDMGNPMAHDIGNASHNGRRSSWGINRADGPVQGMSTFPGADAAMAYRAGLRASICRTIQIQAGPHTITAPTRSPGDLRQALEAIN